MKGTVKWYNEKKGSGFIHGDDNTDIFVHRTAIPNGHLFKGDKVEYKILDVRLFPESERGLRAINIKKL
jgi:cold shock protein